MRRVAVLYKQAFSLLIFSCLFLSGCSQVTVSQDFSNEFDFTTDKTFSWNSDFQAAHGGLLQENELLAKRFQAAVTLALQQKGFQKQSNPVYLVSCSYVVMTKIETEPYHGGISVGMGRYGRYGGWGFGAGPQINQYDQGRLTVNIHSSLTKELICSGLATRQVSLHSSPGELDALAAEMADAVMAQFPPVK